LWSPEDAISSRDSLEIATSAHMAKASWVIVSFGDDMVAADAVS
jgi:predicted DNA-binding protein (MmcQ/YjbR family)